MVVHRGYGGRAKFAAPLLYWLEVSYGATPRPSGGSLSTPGSREEADLRVYWVYIMHKAAKAFHAHSPDHAVIEVKIFL